MIYLFYMGNSKLKAYIFPRIKVNDNIKTLVLRSNSIARIAAGDSLLGFGYLLEGDIKKIYSGNIINRIFGRKNYQNNNEFIEDVKTNFSSCGDCISESELEKFAEKNKLMHTKLIFC